jgi:hypothetical protein
MLQTKSVETKLLELLKFLMEQEEFEDFNLVGGTSLALKIGHRLSVDIDLFGNAEINTEQIIKALKPFKRVAVRFSWQS